MDNSLIATVFKYDSINTECKIHTDFLSLNIEGLTYKESSSNLFSTRIIRLYPQKDTIVFIKPNQYRYWLISIAYRDADKCISDFADAGF
jgi:hypothetical protein